MDAPADPWLPHPTHRSDRSGRADPPPPPDLVSGGGLGGRLGERLGGGLAGRWEVDRRTALALLLAIALVGVVVAAWVLRHQDVGTPIPAATGQVTGVPSAAAVAAAATPAAASPVAGAAPAVTASLAAGASTSVNPVRVQVVGQVRRAGVVSLPVGARVEDAVNAAGGPTRRADLAAVDLARPVVDGEQIYLSRPGERPHVLADPGPAGAGTGAAGAGSAGTTPVNLNTSTAEQLDTLPGVGPILAQRIVQWRQQHGRFSTVDELSEVQGIGDATLEKLRPLVAV